MNLEKFFFSTAQNFFKTGFSALAGGLFIQPPDRGFGHDPGARSSELILVADTGSDTDRGVRFSDLIPVA